LAGTTLDAALAWAARGFRVFPLGVGGKKPALADVDWKTLATTDEARIRELWGTRRYNVGVRCEGLLVVDIDVKDGKHGLESYAALGPQPRTLVVKTGSGGYHVYFHAPPTANTAGELGQGVDTRGPDGYVIAPGSIVNGRAYTLEVDAEIAEAPAALLSRLSAPRERQDPLPVVELDSEAAIARATEYLITDAPTATEGEGGDHVTFRVAAVLKDYGVSEASAFDLMAEFWNELCSPPWPLDELKAKVENAYRYGALAPGAASLEVYTAGLDIDPPRYNRPAVKWFRHGDDWQGSVSWLYYETLPTTGLALLVAPTGGGKTFLVMHLAHTLATGRRFFGVEPEERGGTLLLMGEGAGGVSKRMAALGEKDRLPIYACRCGVLGVTGAVTALEAEIRVMAADMLDHHGVALRLVVLDTLSASGILDDENDNAKAAKALKALEDLAMRLGVLLLITHHPTKTGGVERGAGAIRANVDVILEIQREGRNTVRHLEITKAREAETRPLGAFTLNPVVLGLDAKGREVKSCVVSTVVGVSRVVAAPVHADLFIQSVENALASKPTRVEGQLVVELLHVEDEFREGFTGNRTNRAIDKAFKDARTWAESTGAVRMVDYNGRVYFSPLSAALAA